MKFHTEAKTTETIRINLTDIVRWNIYMLFGDSIDVELFVQRSIREGKIVNRIKHNPFDFLSHELCDRITCCADRFIIRDDTALDPYNMVDLSEKEILKLSETFTTPLI